MTELRYEVLVNDGVPRNRTQRLPDGSPIVSSPLASTLILGEHDAVLVDPPFTREQVARVGDWIERSGKRLGRFDRQGSERAQVDLVGSRDAGRLAPAAVDRGIPLGRAGFDEAPQRLGERGP